jgi:hypothetical protein
MSNKKPERQLKSLYFDKATNQLVKIMQVDKVTVQFKFVNDDQETELTRGEVYDYIDGGRWIEPVAAKPEVNKVVPLPQKPLTESVNNATMVVYCESVKLLKEGQIVKISLNKQNGWSECNLLIKENELKLNLNDLDLDKIKKILEILENRNG